jgi:hypothetical protein
MGNSGLKYYDSDDETLAKLTIYNVSNYEIITIDGNSLIVQAFDIDGIPRSLRITGEVTSLKYCFMPPLPPGCAKL